jgi:hypothetical protein
MRYHAARGESVTLPSVYQLEGVTVDGAWLSDGPDDAPLLRLTSLRHPILRIVSLFLYEDMGEYIDHYKDYDPAGWKQGRADLGLRNWVRFVDWLYRADPKGRRPHSLFIDASNYYVKLLTDRQRLSGSGGGDSNASSPLTNASVPVTRVDLEAAKRALAAFDGVLITEWMDTVEQVDYANALLGTQGLRFSHANMNVATWLPPGGQLAIVPDVLAELEALNALDLELYEYAKNLTLARMAQALAAQGGGRGEGGPDLCGSDDGDLLRSCGPPAPRMAAWCVDMPSGECLRINASQAYFPHMPEAGDIGDGSGYDVRTAPARRWHQLSV